MPMTKLPITTIVPTQNEEANIRACLESVTWADEIFVVDSCSIDRTIAIASQYTNKIYEFNYNGGWPKKKNWALDNLPIKNEWVLLLDADERATPALREEIIALLRDPNGFDGFYINRRLIFLRKWIKHCGWYPSWNLRLFKHKLGRFEKLNVEVPNTGDVEVHEHVVLQGRVGYLKNDLLHEDFKSIYHFIERHNRYSTWEAQMHYNMFTGTLGDFHIGASLLGNPLQRKRLIKKLWVHLPFRPILRFVWMYLLRLGFLDGHAGFIFCVLMSLHEAVISAKMYEMALSQYKGEREDHPG